MMRFVQGGKDEQWLLFAKTAIPRAIVVMLVVYPKPMQKADAGWGFLPLITSPVQDLPAALVIILVAATLMLTTFSTALWLNHSQPSLMQRGTSSGLAN